MTDQKHLEALVLNIKRFDHYDNSALWVRDFICFEQCGDRYSKPFRRI